MSRWLFLFLYPPLSPSWPLSPAVLLQVANPAPSVMVSSLAEQLARSASLNANLLNEKARKQIQSESYLFSAKEARQHDIESLHALGYNGFLQLKMLQPAVAPFEHQLFSDAAKSLDRTLQPAEQNAKLDTTISEFLPLLGPFLLDAPTGKVLEWLVRRFR